MKPNLLARAAALLGLLAAAACAPVSGAVDSVTDAFRTAPAAPVPELVLFVEGAEASGKLVYALDPRKAQLVQPFMHLVDDGFYNGMYVRRSVPGLLAESDNGFWSNRHGRRIRLTEEDAKALSGGPSAGGLALIQNPDGTFGPRLLFMRGTTMLERELVPPGAAIGVLVEGKDILDRLAKGDKITKAYGRNFAAAPEPYY